MKPARSFPRAVPRAAEVAPEPEPRVVKESLPTESAVRPISREPHVPRIPYVPLANPLDGANKSLFLECLKLSIASAKRPRHE